MLTGIEYALTVAQPAATLIVEGPRRFDNHVKPPAAKLLGMRVAIYAAQKPDLDGSVVAMHMLEQLGITEEIWASWKTRTVHGAIIGTALLAGVFTQHDDRWFTGPYGIHLVQPEPLPSPVPATGAPGFWRISK